MTAIPSGSRTPFRPWCLALIVCAAYLTVSITYILLSSTVAESLAGSKEMLARIEQVKGIVFVTLTGGLLFGLTLILFRRVARQHAQIVRQQEELMISEGRAQAGLCAASAAHKTLFFPPPPPPTT